VNALPSRPVLTIDGTNRFCAGDYRILKVSIPAGSTVEWYKNGVVVQAASTVDTLRVSDGATYAVRVYNATGCASVISNTITTEVGCKDVITFPDIFSPNGDGINDTVKPSIPGIKKFRCYKVYNRWGNLVFETTDSSKGWDGKFRYADQPAETYIWLVEGVDTAGKEVKRTGMFTLIR
jgi:gliding motility-associated-like protein